MGIACLASTILIFLLGLVVFATWGVTHPLYPNREGVWELFEARLRKLFISKGIENNNRGERNVRANERPTGSD
jgi:hypothetical protein